MSTFSRFLARLHPAASTPVINMAAFRERRRFRNAMPGELGAREAVRLYGLGR